MTGKIEFMTEKDFIGQDATSIARIVENAGKPKTVLLVPDGSRRVGMIQYRLNPKDRQFLSQAFQREHLETIRILKTIFSHGIKTIFIPNGTHGNLERGREYMDKFINSGVKPLLKDKVWLDFYREFEVRVRLYGDIDVIVKAGYPELPEWIADVERETAGNTRHTIFYGLAMSQHREECRLARIAVDYYEKTGNRPTDKELERLYFGTEVEPVDIFIRPVEVRDSECQPVLIGGKAEMYFPLIPFAEMSENIFRRILYDYLYSRMKTYGRKSYDDGVDDDELDAMREYYRFNSETVLGLGKRRKNGHFWYADSWVVIPEKMKEW